MIDYMEIGPVPFSESCAQLGDIDFVRQAKREMKAFINQLKREFSDWEEKNVEFVIRWFNHDFGRYGEVCVFYDTNDENATDFAFHVEANIPEYWDNDASIELDDSF